MGVKAPSLRGIKSARMTRLLLTATTITWLVVLTHIETIQQTVVMFFND